MKKYVVKVNTDGTIDLYEVGMGIGLDFAPVSVLTISESNVNADDLNKKLEESQTHVQELQAKVDAINAIAPAPTAAV